MAIKGLTDDVIAGYARLGKLRKGGEKTAKGFGPDLDHFRFTSANEEIVSAFHDVYGETPRLVRIYIPHVRVHEAFSTWCEVWGASGLEHRCDGETMTLWREGAKYAKGRKPCTGGHKDGDPLKDSVGRLEFVIPELIQGGFVGYITLETHSKNDILNISRVLEAVYKGRGDLRGVEFSLRRVKENIGVPGWGDRKNDRARVDKWMVRIEPAADWVRLQLDAAHSNAMLLNSGGATAAVIENETANPAEQPLLPAPTAANSDIQEGEFKEAEPEEIKKPAAAPKANGKPPASNKPVKGTPEVEALKTSYARLYQSGLKLNIDAPVLAANVTAPQAQGQYNHLFKKVVDKSTSLVKAVNDGHMPASLSEGIKNINDETGRAEYNKRLINMALNLTKKQPA